MNSIFTARILTDLDLLKDSRQRVEAIHQSLLRKQESGHYSFYQVAIDDLTVIRRTDKLDEFWDFLSYIGNDPCKLEILSYMGQSYRNTRHSFQIGEPPAAKLSQAEMDRKIAEHVAQWKREHELEQLKKDNQRLEAKVKAQEEELDELYAELAELKAKRFDKDNIQGAQVMAFFLEMFPKLAEQYPEVKKFAGFFGLKPPAESKTEDKPEA